MKRKLSQLLLFICMGCSSADPTTSPLHQDNQDPTRLTTSNPSISSTSKLRPQYPHQDMVFYPHEYHSYTPSISHQDSALCTISPQLPTGISIDPLTCEIYGTATGSDGALKTYTVTVSHLSKSHSTDLQIRVYGLTQTWVWVSGSKIVDQSGVYGLLGGLPGDLTSSSVPGSRHSSTTWTDSSGNQWIFGGEGFDSINQFGLLNDVWKWEGSNWAWVAGSNHVNQSNSYTSLTTLASPSGRSASVSWVDKNSNGWVFGGKGYDET